MTYDADGLRSSKTVNGAKTTYQYIGDKLFYESRGNGDSFYYFYDSYGKLSAIYHHRNVTNVDKNSGVFTLVSPLFLLNYWQKQSV